MANRFGMMGNRPGFPQPMMGGPPGGQHMGGRPGMGGGHPHMMGMRPGFPAPQQMGGGRPGMMQGRPGFPPGGAGAPPLPGQGVRMMGGPTNPGASATPLLATPTPSHKPETKPESKGPAIHPARAAMQQAAGIDLNAIKAAALKPNGAAGVPPSATAGTKRFGDAPASAGYDAQKRARPTPQPPVHNPQLAPLRSECMALLQAAQPKDLATLACAAVVGDCRPSIDRLPADFVEGTYGNITKLLGVEPTSLGMFRQRVCIEMHNDMVKFMENVYQNELVQLLVAATHQSPQQDSVLWQKVMHCINTADQNGLLNIRAQAKKLADARLNPTPVAPAAAAAQPGFPAAAAAPPVAAAPPSNPEEENKLAEAALQGQLATVQAILARGININCSPKSGWTPLMNATLQGHLNVVEHLVSAKANLDLKDNEGFTALMYAASYNRVPIVELLVKAGSDLTLTDNAGRTIQQYAQDTNIKLAIERGTAAKSAPLRSSQPAVQPVHQHPAQPAHPAPQTNHFQQYPPQAHNPQAQQPPPQPIQPPMQQPQFHPQGLPQQHFQHRQFPFQQMQMRR